MNKQIITFLLLACATQNNNINARIETPHHGTNNTIVLPLDPKNKIPNIISTFNNENNCTLSSHPSEKSSKKNALVTLKSQMVREKKTLPGTSISNKTLLPVIYTLINHVQKEYGDDIIKHGDKIKESIKKNKHMEEHFFPLLEKLHLDTVADDTTDFFKKMLQDPKVQLLAKAGIAYGLTVFANKYLPDDLLQLIISGGTQLKN